MLQRVPKCEKAHLVHTASGITNRKGENNLLSPSFLSEVGGNEICSCFKLQDLVFEAARKRPDILRVLAVYARVFEVDSNWVEMVFL